MLRLRCRQIVLMLAGGGMYAACPATSLFAFLALHETKLVKPDMQETVSTASEADEGSVLRALGSTYDSRVAALGPLQRCRTCDILRCLQPLEPCTCQ